MRFAALRPGTRKKSPITDSVARPPPARAGRTARRFGAPLTPRLARRPLCGGRRSAVGGRRSAVGGRRPAGETRCVAFGRDSVSAHFQFNKVDASRRAEKCRSLRVKVVVDTVANTRTHARAHARVHIHAHTRERACTCAHARAHTTGERRDSHTRTPTQMRVRV